MTTDTFDQQVEEAWPEVLADSWEVLERARQEWRDQDRPDDLDDRRDEVA